MERYSWNGGGGRWAEFTKKKERMRERVGWGMKRLGCLSPHGLGLADQGSGIYIPCSFQTGPFPVPAVTSGGSRQSRTSLAPRWGSALAQI